MKITTATAGSMRFYPDTDFHAAGINVFYSAHTQDEMLFVSYSNAIECYGEGEAEAVALREIVILCLTMHDELVAALRAYMEAVRGAQDKQSLMAAIRDADDKASAVLAKVDKKEGR